jgi:two-component system sporulation sensor kinase A
MENGKWVYMNTAGLKMFGAACMEDLRGRDPEDLLHPDHRAAARLRAQAILRGEPVGFVEMRFFRLDGQVFHAEVMGMPFGDHGIQVIIRDITRLKRMDELLLQAEKLSAVGQLAAGVAHEIRNPLTSLKGFTQILHEKAEYPERQYFDIMMAELDRIDSILGEMLLLAKPQEVHFQPWDVVPIVQEVVALLLTQAVIKNISVQTDFPAALPFVDCDKSQLKQVFLNVIKNAMEAMPQGGTVRVSGQVSAGDVCIDVMDQGEGIPTDRLPKLGEPFFTTKEKGTGLGLMVSHRILAAHRGTMRFTSEPGKGTTVRICLPASRTGSQHLA